MSEDVVRSLIIKIDKMAIDVAVILTKATMTETQDIKQHAEIDKCIEELKSDVIEIKNTLNQGIGAKMAIAYIITTGISVVALFIAYSALKH